MSTKPAPPSAAEDGSDAQSSPQPAGEEPGTNAVEHEPDPNAQPIADGAHRYKPRGPYTTGND
ncbi:MAG: hypothetical protein JWP43_3309 [Ramlibacter sp.]|jgi:hypothetical protein|nr:hypothetical protein [Ramlibacter sp.]